LASPAAGLPDWARAFGPPLFHAAIRSRPSDFQVTERLDFVPAGAGEHDFLWLRKTGANTDWVARRLARHAGVRPVDVGYAGQKDRHAICSQWFSVLRRGDGADWTAFACEGVEILDVRRHDRKLRRGAHAGNAFRIALRAAVPETDRGAIDARLQTIAAQGVPNYFGPQRFGRDGANLELAAQLFAGRRLRRDKRSMAISAARSYLFNEILALRVGHGSWNRILPGELANLDGSGSVFRVETVDATLERRAAARDIHPTGTLWGQRRASAEGDVAVLENDATAGCEAFRSGLERLAVDASTRPLRLGVGDLSWQFDDDALWLDFTLPRGGFATAVLREIADTRDDGHGGEARQDERNNT